MVRLNNNSKKNGDIIKNSKKLLVEQWTAKENKNLIELKKTKITKNVTFAHLNVYVT